MSELASPTLEASLLGACLMAPAVVERLVVDYDLDAAHLTEPLHRTAWQAIRATWQETSSVDLAAIATRLPEGTPVEAIDALAAEACAFEAVRDVADRIARLALRRSWQDAGYALVAAAGEDDERHVERAQRMLRTEQGGIDSDTWNVQRIQSEVFDFLSSDEPVGMPTGFDAIDQAIGGGLRPGDLTALGGWSKHGKSLVCDQILTSACASGRTAHLFTNEMSQLDRSLRLIAQSGAAPFAKLTTRDLDDDAQRLRVIDAAANLPFGITEVSSWTVEKIARTIRTGGWDIVAFDILQNLPCSETREWDLAIATLLAAARSSDTHLIVVVHLNDARAQTAVLPPPVPRDIRNTGMMQRVAAQILMVYRQQEDEGGFVSPRPEGYLDACLARHGRPGRAVIRLDEDSLRFIDVTPWGDAA